MRIHLLVPVATFVTAWALAPMPLWAQAGAFAYRADRAPAVGTTWHFIKSNRDGSEPWNVDVRVVSPSRIDVLKWRPNGDLVDVEAEMDFARAMPAHMEQRNTDDGRTEMRLEAHLAADGRTMAVRLPNGQGLELKVGFEPYFFYGFDFLGLHFVLPHLATPDQGFEAEFMDPNRPASPGAAEPFRTGRVRFEYMGEDRCRGADCRKYRVRGPFFDGEEGFLWVSRGEGFIERAEHALRTSTDWRDFKLELLSVESRDAFAWQRFKDEIAAGLAPWAVPVAVRLQQAYAASGLDGLFRAYAVARADQPKALESGLNAMGYSLLRAGRNADAVAVLERASRDFPASANAWDSLGEAQAAAGQREAAIQSYRRSLELDPANRRAAEEIEKLGTPR